MNRSRRIKQVELILQSGPEENAAAALAMILTYHGRPSGPWDLAEEPLRTAADVIKAAHARGLYAEGYRMTAQELRSAPFPLIAHWRFHSFVVVTGVRGGRVYLLSPAEGRQVMRIRDFEKGFTGVALCFAGEAGQEAEGERASVRGLFALLPQAGWALAASQLFISGCCVAIAVLLRIFADRLASSASGGRLGLMAAAAALLLAAGALLEMWIFRRCERTLRSQASRSCAAALGEKGPLFFKRLPGIHLAFACEGCGTMPAAIVQSARCALQLCTAGICLIAIGIQEPFAALAAAAASALFAAVTLAGRESVYSDCMRAEHDRLAAGLQSAGDLTRSGEIRLTGQTRSRFDGWMSAAGGQARRISGERQTMLWYVFAAAEIFAVFCICVLRVLHGAIGLPAMAGCLWLAAVTALCMAALPAYAEQNMTLRGVLESWRILLRPERHTAPAQETPVGNPDSLTLQNVSMQPSGEADAGLRGVTVRVRRGEVLAILVDESCNSAALAQVMAGIKAPAQGEVYIGRASARDLDEDTVYESICLLGQGIPLPSGTVRENIAAGCGAITDYDIVEAASDALLHDSILLRRDGYDTPASTLSDGERVLLEFACAFARGAAFLVGDDVTRRLDPETEAGLLYALRRRGIGAALVTKAEDIARRADAVCRLENGRVTLNERAEFIDWEVSALAGKA